MSIELNEKIGVSLDLPYQIVHQKQYPFYDSNLRDAKVVINKMTEYGFWCQLNSPFFPWQNWDASFDKHGETKTKKFHSFGENPALAICEAALKCIKGNPDVFATLPSNKPVEPTIESAQMDIVALAQVAIEED